MQLIFSRFWSLSLTLAFSLAFLAIQPEAQALGKRKTQDHFFAQRDGTSLKVKKPTKVLINRIKRKVRKSGFVVKSEIFEAPEGSQPAEELAADTQSSPRGGGVMGGSNCNSNCNDSCREVYGKSGGKCERIWFWTWAAGVFKCECN